MSPVKERNRHEEVPVHRWRLPARAICGNFDDCGEEASLEIRPGQNVPSGRAWILRAKAAEGKPVKAAAICLSYLQDRHAPCVPRPQLYGVP